MIDIENLIMDFMAVIFVLKKDLQHQKIVQILRKKMKLKEHRKKLRVN